MGSSSNSSRLLKRKRSIADFNSDSPFISSRGPFKRSKSENVSLLKRYLIGCAHLIWVKHDPRERDSNENLIISGDPPKKAPAPSSDLAQIEMVGLYFNGIDRTVVSQSKSKSHLFAPPNFSTLEPYVFPWIRINNNAGVSLSRGHIRHIAFRVWEYLATHGEIVLRYENEDDLPGNMPLGDIRGWWWEGDGPNPRNYDAWYQQYDGSLPGMARMYEFY